MTARGFQLAQRQEYVHDQLSRCHQPATTTKKFTLKFRQMTTHPKIRTHLFCQKRHRERLVQQPQFTLLTLLIIRIPKDPSVKKRSMHVCDHTPDVPRAVRRLAVLRVLDAVQVVHDGFVEVARIPLVEGVDLASGGDSDLR